MMHLGVQNDILKLMEDANNIYQQTGVPLCPCCLFFPCGIVVCPPFCWMFVAVPGLKRLAMDVNKEHEHEGISITFEDDGRIPIGLYVRLSEAKRREYCARKGIAFQMPQTIPHPQPIIDPNSRM